MNKMKLKIQLQNSINNQNKKIQFKLKSALKLKKK